MNGSVIGFMINLISSSVNLFDSLKTFENFLRVICPTTSSSHSKQILSLKRPVLIISLNFNNKSLKISFCTINGVRLRSSKADNTYLNSLNVIAFGDFASIICKNYSKSLNQKFFFFNLNKFLK